MFDDTKYKYMRTYADFDKLRKEDPRIYWSPACQVTMHRLAQEQGDKFFTTSNPNPSKATASLTDTPVQSDWDRKERIEALKRQLQELEQMNNAVSEEDQSNA